MTDNSIDYNYCIWYNDNSSKNYDVNLDGTAH